MVNMYASEAYAARLGGSSPLPGTLLKLIWYTLFTRDNEMGQ